MLVLTDFYSFLYHFNYKEILHATVVKFTTSSSLCAHLTSQIYKNNTFQLKTILFFVHLRPQQKITEKNHPQLSNLQCCNFDMVIFRVAIISKVQNVCLQRRQRRTDDASTRRWRGSQQGPANNDTFIMSLATLSLTNK